MAEAQARRALSEPSTRAPCEPRLRVSQGYRKAPKYKLAILETEQIASGRAHRASPLIDV